MNTPESGIDKHLKSLMAEIAQAASKHDVTAIQRLSKKAAELKELEEQAAAIQNRIKHLVAEDSFVSPNTPTEKLNGRIRELAVEVTEGDIRQNLLKLTPHIKRGKIRIGEQLTIEVLPSGEKFQTVVSDKGNKLRARGEIASFYKAAQVKTGDFVLLTEITPGRWTLRKAPPGVHGIGQIHW